MEHTGFPSDETLASFLDGKLDPETRRRVIEHMTTCDECYATVTGEGDGLHASALPRPLPGELRSPARQVFFAAAAAAAVIIFILVARKPHRDTTAQADSRALALESPSHRSVDGRLSGFPYRPTGPVMRGLEPDDPTKHPENAGLYAAIARVAGHARTEPTPQNSHNLAVAQLLLNHTDEAVKTFRDTLSRSTGKLNLIDAVHASRDAALLSDLSVALIARWKAKHDPADLKLAAETSQLAWRMARTPEFAWNRAMALEAMNLRDDALQAWNEYLTIDASSDWAAEARKHVDTLHSAVDRSSPALSADQLIGAAMRGESDVAVLAGENPLAVAESSERLLLPRWAGAVLAHDTSQAKILLSGLKVVANSNLARLGDTQLRDTFGLITYGDESWRAKFAAAVLDLEEVRAAMTSQETVVSETKLADIRIKLGVLSAPEVYSAAIAQAGQAYYANEITTTIDDTTSVIAEVQRRNLPYRRLLARALWIRGTAYSASGHPIEAIQDHSAALSILQSMADTSGVVGIEMNLAADYSTIGDSKEAWSHRLHGLALVGSRDSLRYVQMLLQGARSAIDDGLIALPMLMLNRQQIATPHKQWPDLRLRGLLWRSALAFAAGDTMRGESDRRAAIAAVSDIQDPAMRDFSTTTPEFIDAQFRDASPEAARSEFSAAIAYARRRHLQMRMVQLMLHLARREIALGDMNSARSTIEEAVEEIDQERGWLASEDARTNYLEARRNSLRDAVTLMWVADGKTQALELAERRKARTLLDLLNFNTETYGDTSPMSASAIAAALPRDVGLVEYSLHRDRLLIWFVMNGRIGCFDREIGQDALAEVARHFVAEFRARRHCPDEHLLFQTLIAPWLADAEKAKAIVFVPDNELAGLPFVALRERIGSPFLVERFQICVAPSASIFLRSGPLQNSDDVSALVAAPDAARGLPASSREARAVASFYPKVELLGGSDATVGRFMRLAQDFSVIHFAGHARDNDEVPMLSALLFWSPTNSEELPAYIIAKAHFPRLKLVFLSACETEPDSDRALQGVAGLARAFIVAGAQTTVATLWPVSDANSAAVGIEFHRRLAEGASPVEALRSVQAQMLAGGYERDWAAYTVIGSVRSLDRIMRPTLDAK